MKGNAGWMKFKAEVEEGYWHPDKFRITQEEEKRAKKKKVKRRTCFYSSMAWRELRYKALKLADGCCTLCGRSKRGHGIVLHVDHIVPRSRDRSLELRLSNLQILCDDCNIGKGTSCDKDWR